MKAVVLAIGAHPDDIEIGCGGTLALLKERGYEVAGVIVTSGEQGGRLTSKAELREIRKSEAQASARALGFSLLRFLDAPDGLTFFSKELKEQLIAIIRDLRPRMVFTHSKTDQFPDHQIVHALTMSALGAAGGPWYPGIPHLSHRVAHVYGYEVWNPISSVQMAVDISAVMPRKLDALRMHASQTATVDYVGAVTGLARYRGAMSMMGEFAEVFEVLKGTL